VLKRINLIKQAHLTASRIFVREKAYLLLGRWTGLNKRLPLLKFRKTNEKTIRWAEGRVTFLSFIR